MKGTAGHVEQHDKNFTALEPTVNNPRTKIPTEFGASGSTRASPQCTAGQAGLQHGVSVFQHLRQQLCTLAGLILTYIAVYPEVRHPRQLVAAAAAAYLTQRLVLGESVLLCVHDCCADMSDQCVECTTHGRRVAEWASSPTHFEESSRRARMQPLGRSGALKMAAGPGEATMAAGRGPATMVHLLDTVDTCPAMITPAALDCHLPTLPGRHPMPLLQMLPKPMAWWRALLLTLSKRWKRCRSSPAS